MEQSGNLTTAKLERKSSVFNILQAFSHLKTLQDPEAILNDQEALQILAQLCMISTMSSQRLEVINFSLKFDFAKMINSLIVKAYEQLDDYLARIQEFKPLRNDSELLKRFMLSAMTVAIVHNFSNFSIKFIKLVNDTGAIHNLFRIIKNKKLIEYAKRDDQASVVYSAIGSMVNLSRVSVAYSDKWKAENAIETLLSVAEELKNTEDCQLASYIVLANIADDDEIDRFKGKF